MQFQPVADRMAGPEHIVILGRITTGQGGGKEVGDGSPDHVGSRAGSYPVGQGLVHRHVTSFEILYEEGGVGNVIEQVRQCHRLRGKGATRGDNRCALFH